MKKSPSGTLGGTGLKDIIVIATISVPLLPFITVLTIVMPESSHWLWKNILRITGKRTPGKRKCTGRLDVGEYG